MKVEIWSDYACPFCYIGKRRFEEALEQFPDRDQVEVVYRSFELDPTAPLRVEQDIHDMLASKYGMPREQAIATNHNVTAQAKSVGLEYNLDTMILTNTLDAHRLTHLAAEQVLAKELNERLLRAYFTDSLNLGDHEVLADLAEEVGMNRTKALEVLASNQYTEAVRADEQEAGQLGIQGVPFFVMDRAYGVSGAQSLEVFLDALHKAAASE
ncbi:putative DsbA family dithiol-disulfide isomerase [Paenibacillus shirakamiensis]|uniref:DsbA family dithiol-disulfide isomerase n=1 Tax=Paenibacillus shirakamiensis TaxID=1265935 RepID=A0ABS4JHN1_9BACL|nr:DsbA family oxidoreductase [Paenibacillus shirakamiensis]MBP2001230.1 putative DsbA family dithiol-disulfide isomerase [Paenibacillus shirakamiensis]